MTRVKTAGHAKQSRQTHRNLTSKHPHPPTPTPPALANAQKHARNRKETKEAQQPDDKQQNASAMHAEATPVEWSVTRLSPVDGGGESMPATLWPGDVELAQTHNIHYMSIISASQIQKKVKRILTLLQAPRDDTTKSIIVVLYAKTGVASKAISIAEIAKRELGSADMRWYQYTTIEESIVERKSSVKSTKQSASATETTLDEMELDDEKEAGFETMKTPFERIIEDKPKIRALPMLRIYLCSARVEKLRRLHGCVGVVPRRLVLTCVIGNRQTESLDEVTKVQMYKRRERKSRTEMLIFCDARGGIFTRTCPWG